MAKKEAETKSMRVSLVMPLALWKRARADETIGTRGLSPLIVKLLEQHFKGAK